MVSTLPANLNPRRDTPYHANGIRNTSQPLLPSGGALLPQTRVKFALQHVDQRVTSCTRPCRQIPRARRCFSLRVALMSCRASSRETSRPTHLVCFLGSSHSQVCSDSCHPQKEGRLRVTLLDLCVPGPSPAAPTWRCAPWKRPSDSSGGLHRLCKSLERPRAQSAPKERPRLALPRRPSERTKRL